jgi:hypothetical protein
MGGIIFFRTTMLKEIIEFYINRLDMKVWLEQSGCTILQYGNLLLGFCQRELVETEGIITLFYPMKEDVDERYRELRDISTTQPEESENYGIYHFYACDPEGRTLEFQCFLHPIDYKF